MKTLVSSRGVVLEIKRDIDGGLVKKVPEASSCFFYRPQRKNGGFEVLSLVAFVKQQRKPLVCLSSKTQAELETPDAHIQDPYPIKNMHVKFQLHKECSFGQQFLIVGDDPHLGSWDPEKAIPMNWSDGNVWSVELDIPVGKSIQFKFILTSDAGNVLWQPGADRIFQTWETENRITVVEDWGDAELQKITEEAQNYSVVEDSKINSDVMIPEADKLTFPGEEPVSDMNLESANVDSYTDPAQILLVESDEEQTVAESFSQGKHVPLVAENIKPNMSKEMMEPNEKHDDSRTHAPSEDSSASEMMVARNINGNNGRAVTMRNMASSNIEGSLMNYEEEGPVLVHGLTSSSAVQAEEFNKEETIIYDGLTSSSAVQAEEFNKEETIIYDGLVGDHEAAETIMPERAETVDMFVGKVDKFDKELEQKPLPAEMENHSESDLQNLSPQAETTDMFNNNDVSLDDEPAKTSQTDEQSASEEVNDVLHNGMQWGRKLLQKLVNFILA